MPTIDRYIVQSAYRNAAGDWYGSTDPDPDDRWFFVRDTAEDAPDWCDDDIAPGPYYEDVEATCKLLNRLARAAQANMKEAASMARCGQCPVGDLEDDAGAVCDADGNWLCGNCFAPYLEAARSKPEKTPEEWFRHANAEACLALRSILLISRAGLSTSPADMKVSLATLRRVSNVADQALDTISPN